MVILQYKINHFLPFNRTIPLFLDLGTGLYSVDQSFCANF